MKNIVLQIILSMLLGNVVFAQDKLDGAWELKFGVDQDLVIKTIKNRLSMDPSTVSNGLVIYKNARIGTDKADLIKIHLQDNEFYQLEAYFYPEDQAQVLSVYSTMKAFLSQKYHAPQIGLTADMDPKEKGTDETGAIWTFPSSTTADSNGEILLSIRAKKYIQLSYLDGKRSKNVRKTAMR